MTMRGTLLGYELLVALDWEVVGLGWDERCGPSDGRSSCNWRILREVQLQLQLAPWIWTEMESIATEAVLTRL